MKVKILENPTEVAKHVANIVSDLIAQNNKNGKKTVLCLPTGSTPIGVYQELIRKHKEEQLSFQNVITFNLDEYHPMQPDSIHSYHRFMHENLFSQIDIPKQNIHIPDGTLEADKYEEYCEQYENQIQKHGGIDLALLGIGRSGHIGFNEPGSKLDSRTRLVLLDHKTRKDAASGFFGETNVPYKAVTMGIATIMDARKIVMLATGENKSSIVFRTLEGEFSDPSQCPAVYLKQHSNAMFVVDKPAAQYLAQEKTPWLFNVNLKWDFYLAKKAVINLSLKLNKGICQLNVIDFYNHGLTSLVLEYNNDVDQLCMKVFEDLLKRISLFNQQKLNINPDDRVLIFSPHPDDDVICMAGMMQRLVRQNQQNMKVVYMTNGSVAVSDQTVVNHLRFTKMSLGAFGMEEKSMSNIDELLKAVSSKKSGDIDPQIIQQLKGNVRKSEAINAVEVVGMKESQTVFIDLPFYRTGEVQKKPLSEEDINIVLKLLETERPHHIFVAGDLTDPHGTHRKCYFAIKQAIDLYREKYESSNQAEYPTVTIWLYRGAWQEWDCEDVSVFVPLTKYELDIKIDSIFKHQSQKDRALFPGNDSREFWQRARDRNISTAKTLSTLGLPQFFAAEAFVIVSEMPT